MKIYFILCLLPFISCGQVHTEFNLQNSFPVTLEESVCINADDCFCFSSDSNVSYLMMHYPDVKCEKKNLVDTVDFSPYKSMIHSFKSQKKNTYVVLWETEYEYFPVIIAYYIAAGKLVRMGELKISLHCQSCESLDYLIKYIQIFQEKDEIEISFVKDLKYKENDDSEWQLFKAGTLKYRFNTETNELRVVL